MAASAAAIALALEIVQKGVDWSAKRGGVCPRCGQTKCEIVRTMKWEGNSRTRYHRCKCGKSFKSVEEE